MRFSKIFRFSLGSRILAFKVNIWNEKLSTYYGVTNETSDGFYVPFWDFVENINPFDLHNSLKWCQEEYGLSDIHILQTAPKASFRAVCFDKLEWREYVALLADTDLLDMSYLRHSVMRGRAVLRISNKPSTENKVIHTLLSDSLLRVKSVDHLRFFSWLFGISQSWKMIEPPKKLNLRLSKYETFR